MIDTLRLLRYLGAMTGLPLTSPEGLISFEETLDVLTRPGEAEAIREGLADAADGNFENNQTIKDEFLR